MKKLVTPAEGSARYFAGKLLTGGHHYALVSEADTYAARQITLGEVEVLTAGDTVVRLPDAAQEQVLKEIVQDYLKTNIWDKNEQSYVEHIADAYRFGAEAYTSELNGESEEAVEAKVAAQKAAEEADKAVAEAKLAEEADKAVAEAKLAEEKAAEEAVAKKAAEEAAAKKAAAKLAKEEAAAQKAAE